MTETMTEQQPVDSGPDQIDVSGKFPGATRVENGVAYDVAGKALGNVDVEGSAQAHQPAPDPFAALGATSAPKPQAAPGKDPFEEMGAVAAPSAQPKPEEGWFHQNVTQPFMNDVHRVKNAILENTGPGWLPYDVLTKMGVKADTAGEFAPIDWAKEVPVPPPATDAEAAAAIQNKATLPRPTGGFVPKTVEEAKKGIDYLRSQQRAEQIYSKEYEAKGESRLVSPERLMTAQEAKDNPVLYGLLHFAGQMTTEENAMIMVGTQGLGFVGEAAKVSPQLGALAKFVAATPRMVSAYFAGQMAIGTVQAVPGLYESKKEYDQAIASGDTQTAARIKWDATVHATEAVSSAYMSYAAATHAVTGKAEPVASYAAEATRETLGAMADTAQEMGGNVAAGAKAGVKAAKELAGNVVENVGKVGALIGRTNDYETAFTRAMKVTPKKAAELKSKVEDVKETLQSIQNNNPDADSPTKVADAIDSHLQENEANMQREAGATKDEDTPVTHDFQERVQDRLDKFFEDNRGKFGSPEEVEQAKKDITARVMSQDRTGTDENGDPIYQPRVPNLFETENIRQGLNNETKPQYATNAKPTTDAYKAGGAQVLMELRSILDESYAARGVDNVQQFREQEAKLIEIGQALRDAQAKADKMGQGGVLKSLMTKIGVPSTVIAIALGHPVGAAAITAAVVGDQIHQNLTNPNVNINRAADIAAKNPGAAAMGVDVVPAPGPLQGPRQRPAAAPPPTDHATYSALSSYYGKIIGAVPYDKLVSDFQKEIQDVHEKKATGTYTAKDEAMEPRRQAMLDKINNAKSKQRELAEKAEEKAAADAAKAQEKATADAAKKAEADKAKEEADKAAAIEAAKIGKTKTGVNPELDKLGRGDESGLVSHPVADGMAANAPVMPIAGLAEGQTTQTALREEFSHVGVGALVGLEPLEIRSDQHPLSQKGAGATSVFNAEAIKNPDGSINPEALALQEQQWLVQKMAGPASHEVFDGMSREDIKAGPSNRQDFRDARNIYRQLHPDATPAMVEAALDKAYDVARGWLEKPHIADRIRANADVREQGLPVTHHASRGRTIQFSEDLTNAHRQAGTNGRSDGGEAGGGGEKAAPGEPEGKKAAGAGEGGRGEGAPKSAGGVGATKPGAEEELAAVTPELEAREKRRVERSNANYAAAAKDIGESQIGKIPVPKETTTGKPEVDEAIRAGGGIPGGVQKGFEYKDRVTGETKQYPDTAYVHEPTSGTSLNFPLDQITPEFVKQRLDEKRAEYAAAEKPKVEESQVSKKEEENYHPDLQAVANKYGTSTDPTGVKRGASFIAPDGKFIHLGATEHPVAIESATNRVGDAEAVGAKMTRSNGPEDSRIGFLKDTGAIRTRFRSSVAGKELVASVPAAGVSEEQISALRQAVGQGLGRNGNLLMEVGEPGGKSATKEFASPRDVEPMLREIGAHPESRLTGVEQSNIGKGEKSQLKSAQEDYNKEHDFASGILKGEHKVEDFPYFDSYKKTIDNEAKLLPKNGKILFVGSGPVPASSILFDRAGFNTDSLELDPATAKMGENVARASGMKSGKFMAGDARDLTPEQLKDYDGVVVALEAGPSDTSKNEVLNRVMQSIKPGTKVLARGTADAGGQEFVNVEKNLPKDVHSTGSVDTFDGYGKTHVLEKANTEWPKQAAEKTQAGEGFTHHPVTGNTPNSGYMTEIAPEVRATLDKPATESDIRKFADDNKALLAQHPELHVGGYKNELNVAGRYGTKDAAVNAANKLDQEAVWDAGKQNAIPTEGKNQQREFPNYPMADRVKDLEQSQVAKSPKEEKKWYHGTSEENHAKILEQGEIRPGQQSIYKEDQPRQNAVYVTTDPETGKMYAEEGGRKGKVVEVKVDPKKLVPDEDDVHDLLESKNSDLTPAARNMQERLHQIFLDDANEQAKEEGFEPFKSFKDAKANYDEQAEEWHGSGSGELAERVKNLTDRIVEKDPKLAKQIIDTYGKAAHIGPAQIAESQIAKAKSPEAEEEENSGIDTEKKARAALGGSIYTPEQIADLDPWRSQHDREAGQTIDDARKKINNSNESGFIFKNGDVGIVGESYLHDPFAKEIGVENSDTLNKKIDGARYTVIGDSRHPNNAPNGLMVEFPGGKISQGQAKALQAFLVGHGDNLQTITLDVGGNSRELEAPNRIALARAIRDLNTGTLEESQIGKSPKGSSVPLMTNPLEIEGTGKKGRLSTLDVAQALNEHSREKNPALQPGSDAKAMTDRAMKIAEDEAKYQLAQGKTGTEWYTTEMKDHDKALQGMRPELAGGEMLDTIPDHPVKLSLFKAAEAVLSSGQKPYGNFKATVKAWDAYNETGQFPRLNPATGKSWGPRGEDAYGNALDMINKLIGDKGEKGAAEWLLADHPVSELKQLNKGVKGRKTDMRPGAMILGDKRGPFMQNLHGIESAFTADMWVSRTWNRWMGTMEFGKDKEGNDEIKSDSPRNGAERALMKQSFEGTAKKLGLTTSSLQAVLWYYEQALYGAQGIPKESWSFRDAAQRAAREEAAIPESERTGFNFGANEAKAQGGMGNLGSLTANPKVDALGRPFGGGKMNLEESHITQEPTYTVPKGWSKTGPAKAPGMISPGNIDLTTRPVVKNDDGTTSSEYSTSMEDENGHEVLVPTVVNGKFLTPDGKKPPEGHHEKQANGSDRYVPSPQEKMMFQKAWQHYKQTGQHLGIFDNGEHADAAADAIHSRPPVKK